MTESSDNPGVFRGLVDLVASLDNVLEDHLKTVTVFKGTSKTVQKELLDCMLSVLKTHILGEVNHADYLAIQADETTDISTRCQLVLVLRYVDRTAFRSIFSSSSLLRMPLLTPFSQYCWIG